MILPIPSRRSHRVHKNVKTGSRLALPIRSYPRANFQRTIFALPPELIFQIFSYISDPCQACFVLTCSVFYQKFRHILQNHGFQRPKGEEYSQRCLGSVRSLLLYSTRSELLLRLQDNRWRWCITCTSLHRVSHSNSDSEVGRRCYGRTDLCYACPDSGLTILDLADNQPETNRGKCLGSLTGHYPHASIGTMEFSAFQCLGDKSHIHAQSYIVISIDRHSLSPDSVLLLRRLMICPHISMDDLFDQFRSWPKESKRTCSGCQTELHYGSNYHPAMEINWALHVIRAGSPDYYLCIWTSKTFEDTSFLARLLNMWLSIGPSPQGEVCNGPLPQGWIVLNLSRDPLPQKDNMCKGVDEPFLNIK